MPGLIFRSLRRAPPLGLTRVPSFARALRRRGLIASPLHELPESAFESSESSVAALSMYEAHVRRNSMEQAFATLRGERD